MSHQAIKSYLATVGATIGYLKTKFERYIQDKEISLEERWEAFKNAPSNLKNHENYISSFNTLPDDFIMYEGPIHVDRYETVDTVSVVDRIIENQALEKGSYRFDSPNHREHMKVNLDAFKEEILEYNIGSFNYDW